MLYFDGQGGVGPLLDGLAGKVPNIAFDPSFKTKIDAALANVNQDGIGSMGVSEVGRGHGVRIKQEQCQLTMQSFIYVHTTIICRSFQMPGAPLRSRLAFPPIRPRLFWTTW